MMRRLALLVLAALAVTGAAIAWVGESGNPPRDPPAKPVTSTIPGDADPAETMVIDEWARTLRRGDIDGAARFFALPSVAENGAAPIEISNLDDARLFNATLPCGARLLAAEAEGEFTVATFELTERPGPGFCGAGVGGRAMTAFVIEEGRIVEWRRVGADGGDAGETGHPS